MKKLLIGLTLFASMSSFANESYSYKNGECMNDIGEVGYNAEGSIGGMPCMDLRNRTFSGRGMIYQKLVGSDLSGAIFEDYKPFIMLGTFKGAIFDSKTVLPFSVKEAFQRGMKYKTQDGVVFSSPDEVIEYIKP